jgi:hypothetical protein
MGRHKTVMEKVVYRWHEYSRMKRDDPEVRLTFQRSWLYTF